MILNPFRHPEEVDSSLNKEIIEWTKGRINCERGLDFSDVIDAFESSVSAGDRNRACIIGYYACNLLRGSVDFGSVRDRQIVISGMFDSFNDM